MKYRCWSKAICPSKGKRTEKNSLGFRKTAGKVAVYICLKTSKIFHGPEFSHDN